jgi:hypothetical protein
LPPDPAQFGLQFVAAALQPLDLGVGEPLARIAHTSPPGGPIHHDLKAEAVRHFERDRVGLDIFIDQRVALRMASRMS